MPKQRKLEDRWLPPRVYRHTSSYIYKPASGQTVTLCPLDSPEETVWREYNKLIKQPVDNRTVATLVQQFFASADFRELAATTQKDYRKYSLKVLAVFGKMLWDKVEPHHVRQYMDLRGLKSRVQANREKAFFSRVYRWAYERGMVKSNPCQGVRQYKEKARDRYVTDVEYQAVYERANLAVQVAMEISYLCAARKGDVLKLTFADVLDEGLFIQQGKTGVKQIKEWTPRLRAVIDRARSISTRVRSTRVIVKLDGMPYSDDGFNSAWRDAVLQARAETGLPLDFTFHDLKAKAISDFEGSSRDKQQFSGHKTETQVTRYDRKVKVSPTLK
jgi:integrase